jgi:hypothetical protein
MHSRSQLGVRNGLPPNDLHVSSRQLRTLRQSGWGPSRANNRLSALQQARNDSVESTRVCIIVRRGLPIMFGGLSRPTYRIDEPTGNRTIVTSLLAKSSRSDLANHPATGREYSINITRTN